MRFLRLTWLLFFWLTGFLPAIAQQFEWAKPLQRVMPSYRPAGNQSTGRLSVTDSNGSSYVTGEFKRTLTLGGQTITSPTRRTWFVAKYDSAGTLLWAQPGAARDTTRSSGVVAIRLDAAENPVLLTYGYDSLTVAGWSDSLFLTRFSPAGVLRRHRPLRNVSFDPQRIDDVQLDAQGGLYLQGAGLLVDSLNGQPYVPGLFITSFMIGATLRLDSALRPVLFNPITNASQAQGPVTDGRIQPAGQTGYYLAANCTNFMDIGGVQFAGSAVLAKCDSSGVPIWWKESDRFQSVAVVEDAAGNVYWAGHAKVDGDFDPITIDSVAVPEGVVVAKFNSSGQLQWLRGMADTSMTARVADLLLDPNGGVTLLGTYHDSTRLSAHFLPPPDSADVFVASYDGNGTVRWVATGGGSSAETARSLSADGQGNFYLHGQTMSATGFGGASLLANPVGGPLGSFFLAKLHIAGPMNTPHATKQPVWHLYPNPATAGVSVATELATAGPVQLDVLDPLGRLVRQHSVAYAPTGAFEQTLDLAGVAPGLYSVRLRLPGGGVLTKRLVRQ